MAHPGSGAGAVDIPFLPPPTFTPGFDNLDPWTGGYGLDSLPQRPSGGLQDPSLEALPPGPFAPLPSTAKDPGNLALGSSTGTAPSVAAAAADPLTGVTTAESGDYAASTATTGRIGIGGNGVGSIKSKKDRDWLAVSLVAGRSYTFRANAGSLKDPNLNLRDNGGAVLRFDNNGGGGKNALITYSATSSGTFYLDVGAASKKKAKGTYTVQAFDTTPAPAGSSNPNDDYGAGVATNGQISATGSASGVIEVGGDRDWFRCSLEAGRTYQFSVTGTGLSDPDLALMDAAGNQLTYNDDASGLNPAILFKASTSGTFYLNVGAYGASRTGGYLLQSQDLTPADDFGSSPATSSPLTIDSQQSGSLELPGDHDLFAINLTAGRQYQFNARAGTLSDPCLWLRASDNSVVAFNDNAQGLDAQITYSSSVDRTLYLDVGASDNQATGTYTASCLDITAGTPVITGLSDTTISQLTTSSLKDGIFSKLELYTIISSAEDGGSVDSNELQDLKTISSKLGLYLESATSSYYTYIYNGVVNDNPANASWTGGQASSVSLGNLAAGSSASQLDLLMQKWFGGKDRPVNAYGGDAAAGIGGSSFTYGTANGPLFSNGISFDDVNQGKAGTCYFLAAAAALATSQPALISRMFCDNGDGTYGVRFYSSSGSELWTTVDRQLPIANGQLLLAGNAANDANGELWVALAEKAYAQANEIGQFNRTARNNYTTVEGGLCEALRFLSGSSVTGVSAYYSVAGTSSAGNNSSTWASYEGQAINALNAGKSLWLGSWGATSGGNGKSNFINGHAFAVIGYNSATGRFTLANPWGSDALSWNATFEASWAEMFPLKALVCWTAAAVAAAAEPPTVAAAPIDSDLMVYGANGTTPHAPGTTAGTTISPSLVARPKLASTAAPAPAAADLPLANGPDPSPADGGPIAAAAVTANRHAIAAANGPANAAVNASASSSSNDPANSTYLTASPPSGLEPWLAAALGSRHRAANADADWLTGLGLGQRA